MNLATEFPQIITRLGWAVVHSLWEGVAIGIALALVLMVLRRGSAASRHAACLLAMIAMIAALAITAGLSCPCVRVRAVDWCGVDDGDSCDGASPCGWCMACAIIAYARIGTGSRGGSADLCAPG
jgi:hypothetical protein